MFSMDSRSRRLLAPLNTRDVLTSTSLSTYIVPVGARQLRIIMIGGGASGAGLVANGNNGNGTVLWGVTAAGGSAGSLSGNAGQGGSAGSNGSNPISGLITLPGSSGANGTLNGGSAGLGAPGGQGGPGLFGTGSASSDTNAGANTGAGGGGQTCSSAVGDGGGGGGAGETKMFMINNPPATISYQVGAKGASVFSSLGAGADGVIIVEVVY